MNRRMVYLAFLERIRCHEFAQNRVRRRLTTTAPRGRLTTAVPRALLTTVVPRPRRMMVAVRLPRERVTTAVPRGPLTTAVPRAIAFASGASMVMIPKNAVKPRAASTDKRIVVSLVGFTGSSLVRRPYLQSVRRFGRACFPQLERAFPKHFWSFHRTRSRMFAAGHIQ